MLVVFGFLSLLILVLVQVSLVPLNLAFAALVWYALFVEKNLNLGWILTASILISLFGNISLGVGVVGLTCVFLLINLLSQVVPSNRLVNGFLVILSLPLAEVGLLVLSGG